jgi:AcrR family transcriptional regulator
MLYYYFNSKENILREVIMNIFLTYKKDEISRFNINNLIDEGGLISDQDIESNMDMVLEYIK